MAGTTQTTTKKNNTYNPAGTLGNLDPGLSVNNNQTDLSKYGIDYSQEEQDRIANIFRQEATGAYGQAQNQYSADIANQQATLSDTIRRSQAEAVATGASRGMQAANELSSILGLQQAAAEGATSLQGDYAAALANAQKQAAELQTQRAQVGAEIFNADAAANAQKYAANVDFAANDPERIFSMYDYLKNTYGSEIASAQLKSYLAANGVSQDSINQTLADIDRAASGIGSTASVNGNNGYVDIIVKTSGLAQNNFDYDDASKGKGENGNVYFNGKKYDVKVQGVVSSDSTISALNSLAGTSNPKSGKCVYYQGQVYISANGKWCIVTKDGGLTNAIKNYKG